jgi:hypothetical protein
VICTVKLDEKKVKTCWFGSAGKWFDHHNAGSLDFKNVKESSCFMKELAKTQQF